METLVTQCSSIFFFTNHWFLNGANNSTKITAQKITTSPVMPNKADLTPLLHRKHFKLLGLYSLFRSDQRVLNRVQIQRV